MSTGRKNGATTAASGACHWGRISHSHLRHGASICAALGIPLETHDEIERACGEYGLPVDDLDTLLDGFGWEDRWDNLAGPQAKAHYLLKDLDLGHSGSALRQAGQIIFEEFGGSPANSYTWVELRDDLTVSLLQARLIELNLPINVAVGTRD
jgi:hypothetical protein